MEKLSSGLRINRAGDDAAGLAISEKMRGQIKGLEMATKNAQDGISLIQTAEGALNETHAILQRMRELAVQSSNDTNTDADRQAIQEEVNQLAEEITRIAETTEFNTQNLLGGDFKGKFHIGANEGQNISVEINNMSSQALGVSGDGSGEATFEIAGTLNNIGGGGKTGLEAGEQTLNVVEVDNITTADGKIANYGLANEDGEIVAISQDGKTYNLLTEATKTKELNSATKLAVGGSDVTFTFNNEQVIGGKVTLKATEDANGNTTGVTDIKATASVDVKGLETGKYTVATFSAADHLTDVNFAAKDAGATNSVQQLIDKVVLNEDDEVVAVSFKSAGGDSIQGAAGNAFYSLEDLSLEGNAYAGGAYTGIIKSGAEAVITSGNLADKTKFEVKADGGIDVSSQEAADKAITTINKAIETVSAERSKLGAVQNRLDHTINNLGTSAENLTAAESRIRDVDMAKEMMEFTKNNILSQAAQSMLAQSQQMPQSVLQLLQ